MSIPPAPEPSANWSFSADQGVTCPECSADLTGLNWIMGRPDPGLTEDIVTGMSLIPCGHILASPPWDMTHGARGALRLKKTGD